MSFGDAIAEMKNKILAVNPGAEIKRVKLSDEEARLLCVRAFGAPGGDQSSHPAAGDGSSPPGRPRHPGLCR
jgi:hypothetical protein